MSEFVDAAWRHTVAHEPVPVPLPDPIDDQLPTHTFVASVREDLSPDRRHFRVLPVLPREFDVPARRYWEMALEEDPDDYPIF